MPQLSIAADGAWAAEGDKGTTEGSDGESDEDMLDVPLADADAAGDKPQASGQAASVAGVVFNLVNTVIGVGILSIPYCFKRAGLVLGAVVLVSLCILTEQTLMLLVRAGDVYGTSSYAATAGICFGKRVAIAVDVFVLLLNFGTAVVYLDVRSSCRLDVYRRTLGLV